MGPSRSRRYLGLGDLTSELLVRGAHDPGQAPHGQVCGRWEAGCEAGLATLSRLRMPSRPRVAMVPWWELSEPVGVLGGH